MRTFTLGGITAGRFRRLPAASAAVVTASALVLTGCGDDSAGPEAGAVTSEDLQALEEQVGALDERIGTLEEGMAAPVAEPGTVEPTPDIVGQQVTVSATVSEVITSTDVGSAFRIAADSGPTIAVLSTSPPQTIEADDVVQITGTVRMVNRDTFEEDFGVAADELFDDSDGFFTESEGQPAIAASAIEVLQEQAGG